MRTRLNTKMIEANRYTPIGSEWGDGDIPRPIRLEWEAWLQVHNFAADIGVLGRDEGLHNLLDERLAFFEEESWRE